MRDNLIETVTGVFVLVGLVLVGYMTVELGNVSFMKGNTYRLTARFSAASGLREGNTVEIRGIEVGSVESLALDQETSTAQVTLKIDNGVKVFDDAIASIKTAGLIGDRYVSIDPGGGGILLEDKGTIIDTEAPTDIGDLLGKYAFGTVDSTKQPKNDNKDGEGSKEP